MRGTVLTETGTNEPTFESLRFSFYSVGGFLFVVVTSSRGEARPLFFTSCARFLFCVVILFRSRRNSVQNVVDHEADPVSTSGEV
ncbi:Hypothetical protein NTJ_05889 [Nesidiocoris tenuis]|uniref:Uncharacterized protein n=1 Tax=Nesidiocoris tenuis TaxID=355587 RepID=A0ABN7ALH9_9HEMI|nr:Hypothetical protein NTJ_05889 [Nesidiocoris tenuis]